MDTPIIPHPRSVKPEAYHALAARRGMKWVGPYTGSVGNKTTWECSIGHQFEMTYTHLNDPRYGCSKCARWQPEDYRERAKQLGIEWLGPYPTNAHSKTRWRCSCGNEWDDALHGLSSSGCPECSYRNRHDPLRLTADDYRRLADKFGVIWMGRDVRNSGEKTAWSCAQGHEWEATYRNFRGCTVCNYPDRAKERRNTQAEYRALATERNIVWLGPEVTSAAKRTDWQCAKGHVWSTSYNCILGGCGCRRCAYDARQELHRRKPADYVTLALERGFTWLGPEVKTTKYVTQWQCASGHIWKANFNNIQKGTSCPDCLGYINGVRASKPQLELCAMLGGVANHKVERYSIDAALPDQMIAVEYDCEYWHSKNGDLDARKTNRLIELGWKVLRVKAQALLPSYEQLNAALSSLRNGDTYQEIVLSDWAGEPHD